MSDSQHANPDSEADYLVEQYVAGRLTEVEATRLHALLREQPALGETLLGQVRLDAMLRDLSKADRPAAWLPLPTASAGSPTRERGSSPDRSSPDIPSLTHRAPGTAGWPIRPRVVAWLAAACLLIGAAIAFNRWSGRDDKAQLSSTTAPATQPVEATTSAVAVLARAVDVNWTDSTDARDAGAPLEPGWLRIKSGLVQVEFFSGARVLLEGPAELRLDSPMEAFCQSGKLSAEVPPQAQGFRVGTPKGTVVDLGTAFGVDVSGGAAQVHVFKGKVELHQQGSPRGLVEGQAIAMESDGLHDIAAKKPDSFASIDGLEKRSVEAQHRRFEAWRAAATKLEADPGLLIRFDFADATIVDRLLSNTARLSAVSKDALIVGCGRAEGRWPDKPALEFRGVSDRVRLQLPGEYESVTFAAWVWVNGLDRRYNSLFLADGFSSGALHWQILNDGHVRLGVGGSGDYDSPIVFAAERFGRWMHLAVVYDATIKRVTHYVNGQPANRQPLRTVVPVKIGAAELGNWNPSPRKDHNPVRYFSGRMDEFEMFGRALKDEEVRKLATE